MGVPINLEFESYTGAGNLDEYTFDFKITDKNQLLVVVQDASGDEIQRVTGDDLTYLSDVSFDPLKGGGTVYLQADLPASYEIFIFLADDAPKQEYQFTNLSQFSLKNMEFGLDAVVKYLTRAMFWARNSVKLYDTDAVKVQQGDATFDPTLPKGLVDNTADIVPYFTNGGWAPVADWPELTDLYAAIASAADAAASAASALAAQTAATAATAAAAASATSAAASAAAAQDAVDAANGLVPDVINDGSNPDSVSGELGTGVFSTYWFTKWWVQGLTNGEVLTGIADGGAAGQELLIMQSAGTNNFSIPDSAANVILNGSFYSEANRMLSLIWDGQTWVEQWRR